MSTKASEDTNPNSSGASEDKEGGLLPAILAGAGILAVVGLLAFWPDGGDDAESGSNAAGAKGGKDAVGAAAAGGAKRGGVEARDADEPARRAKSGKINPAIKLPAVGMAPGVPPVEEPPNFKNRDEEIAWYERKLEQAVQMRESRKQFADRLPKMRERIEQSDNPDAQLKAFESRKKIVEDNFTKAQERVEEIEAKLAALRQ